MLPDALTLLEDMRIAAERILELAADRRLDDLEQDWAFRSAIERQFEIIGEALGRLAKRDPQTAEELTDYRLIINFRNRLIHAYDSIDCEVVWQAVRTSLPELYRQVVVLLGKATGS
jgi:uncharacterized protein with HEPN domain